MTTSPRRTYPRTARAHVLNFVQLLGPSAAEAPYLAAICGKSSLTMRDAKTLCDYIASRAAVRPLQGDTIAALGLPSLPQHSVPEAAQSAI